MSLAADMGHMGLMGWSTTAMAARYQHITGAVRGDVAERIGGLIWGSAAGE
jgi:integrase